MNLLLVSCLLAFLIGGIPFGYLVGRLVLKDDIRRHGSGNIGATNVGRVIGWKWGSLVLLLDALKGLLPTLGTRIAATDHLPAAWVTHATIAAGVCAIIGHMYPIYLQLRGGKGVATALGVVLVVAPLPSAAALAMFLVVAAITRIVAVASIAAALSFSVVQLALLGRLAWTPANYSLTAFSIVVPALIIWRHRSNIRRLLNGERGTPPTAPETPSGHC